MRGATLAGVRGDTLAFRNGPIKTIHAGKPCPTCADDPGYSRISDAEMRVIMKSAVDRVYQLLEQRETEPCRYAKSVEFGSRYTRDWDEPERAAGDVRMIHPK